MPAARQFLDLVEITVKDTRQPGFEPGFNDLDPKEGFLFRLDSKGEITLADASIIDDPSNEVGGGRSYVGQDGYVLRRPKIIYLYNKNLDKRWADSTYGDRRYVQKVVAALVSQLPELAEYEVYGGWKSPGQPIEGSDRYGAVSELLSAQEEPHTSGGALTLFHGTSSTQLPTILKRGLVSNLVSGINQWNTTGRYYEGKAPVYLTSLPNRAWEYAEQAHKNNPGGEPIILAVRVPADNTVMRADDDWIDGMLEDNPGTKPEDYTSRWQDSLKQTSQIVYLGRIPPKMLSLHYPKELSRKPLDHTFEQPVTSEDVAYRDSIDVADSAGVSPDHIRRMIDKLSDDTYWLDEVWERINSGEESNEDLWDAFEDIASSMDEYIQRSPYRDTLEAYENELEDFDVDEFLESDEPTAYLEDWELDDHDKEKLLSAHWGDRHNAQEFARWRAELMAPVPSKVYEKPPKAESFLRLFRKEDT